MKKKLPFQKALIFVATAMLVLLGGAAFGQKLLGKRWI